MDQTEHAIRHPDGIGSIPADSGALMHERPRNVHHFPSFGHGRRATICDPHLCLLAFSFLVSICLLGPARAQGEQSIWQSLPEETALAIRIANGTEFLEAMRANTKLGAVLLSQERIERIKEIIEQQEEGQEFNENLAQYGVTLDDMLALLAGESGYALAVIEEDEADLNEMPLFVGIGWVEPGEELAERFLDAIGKSVEDQADEGEPLSRVDFEINGLPVMQLTVGSFGTVDDMEFELDEVEVEEHEEREIDFGEDDLDIGPPPLKYHRMLLIRLGGRLLVTHTFNPTEEVEAPGHVESLTAILTHLISAHRERDPGEFTARMMADENVQDVFDLAGIAAFEVLIDLARVIEMANTQPQVSAVMESLGLENLGPTALRLTLDDTIMRNALFVGAPAPRQGLLALLDQPPLQAEPPAWVPANVVSYNHVSADLGQIYLHIKQMILQAAGEEARMMFQAGEMQVMVMTQADLPTILSSLGHRHMVLTFEHSFQQPDQGPQFGPAVPMQQRMAIVWHVTDEALWTRILQVVAAMTQNTGNPLHLTEEQGFRGLRISQGPITGGLFLGKGNLIFALGPSVIEATLSSLNSPPTDKNALLTSDTFARAQTLLKLEPGLNFQVMDGDRYVHTMNKIMNTLFNMVFHGPVSNRDPDREIIAQLKDLMPTDEELEHVLGVSTNYILVNDDGLVGQGISELPGGNE